MATRITLKKRMGTDLIRTDSFFSPSFLVTSHPLGLGERIREKNVYYKRIYIYTAMITEDKIKALRQQLKRGVPDGEIRETMMREGYSAEDIDTVFAPHQYNMKSWYFTFGIILFFAGTYQLLTNNGFLLLLLSFGLFFQYYKETKRLERK